MPPIPPEAFLTIAEAAALTNYTESIVLEWIAAGLPHIAPRAGQRRPRRKDMRIRRSVLLDWVAGLEVKRVPPPSTRNAAPTPRRSGTPPNSAGLGAWRTLRKES